MDLGNWKCRLKGELLVGASHEINGDNKANLELKARVEGELTHKSVPWIALAGWIEVASGHLGKSESYNATIKGTKNLENMKFEPFVGIEKHFSEMDKQYGIQSQDDNEIFHKLGVTIIF